MTIRTLSANLLTVFAYILIALSFIAMIFSLFNIFGVGRAHWLSGIAGMVSQVVALSVGIRTKKLLTTNPIAEGVSVLAAFAVAFLVVYLEQGANELIMAIGAYSPSITGAILLIISKWTEVPDKSVR